MHSGCSVDIVFIDALPMAHILIPGNFRLSYSIQEIVVEKECLEERTKQMVGCCQRRKDETTINGDVSDVRIQSEPHSTMDITVGWIL